MNKSHPSKLSFMKHTRFRLPFLLLLMALASCSALHEVVTPEVDEEAVAVSETLSAMQEKQASFDYFASRFAGTATVNDTHYDVSGTIRIKKDSAIYLSLSPFLGIEMARVLITPEEVLFLNRLEGTYYQGDMERLNRMFNTNLDFHMLQAILVGNDFAHFTSDRFSVSRDKDRLLLRNPERYPITGAALGLPFQQNIWLDQDSYLIRENLVYEPRTQRSIRARYDRYNQVGQQDLPGEVTLVMTDPGNRVELSMRYTRTTIDEPQPMEINIPERYRRME